MQDPKTNDAAGKTGEYLYVSPNYILLFIIDKLGRAASMIILDVQKISNVCKIFTSTVEAI